MPFDPKEYLARKMATMQPIEEQTPPPPEISELESALRGGAQGLAFDFADEIAGGVESAFTDKTYEQARNESREAFKAAQQANPGAYLAGELGGAVAPAVVSYLASAGTGGAAAPTAVAATSNLARLASGAKGLLGVGQGAATTAGRIGQAAIGGALQGLGGSEGESLGDLARDTAIGGALGGASAGLIEGGGRALAKGAEVLPSGQAIKEGLENRIAGGITGLSDEGVDVLRKTPDALTRIERLGEGTKDDILDRATEEVKTFIQKNPIKERINQNYEKAYSALEKSGVTVDPSQAKQILQSKIDSLNVGGKRAFSDTDIAAQSKLQDYLMRLDDLSQGGEISAVDTKALIGQIRNDIDTYGSKMNQSANPVVQNSLKELQGYFDSTILKKNIPEFRKTMAKIAKDMQLASGIDNAFISRIGKSYDVDPNKIKNVLKGELSSSTKPRQSELTSQLSKKMEAFDRLSGDTSGSNLRQTLDDLKLKQMVESRSNQGSNLVNAGAGLGAVIDTMTGLPFGVGTGIGALTGKRLETTGRKLASSYFQNQVDRAPQIIEKVNGTKYANVLRNAAERGTRNFAVANYLLQQQDPEYRTLIEND